LKRINCVPEPQPITYTPPKEAPAVVLELTMEQAQTLVSILEHIGGPPAGPRGAVTPVYQCLMGGGVFPAGRVQFKTIGTSSLYIAWDGMDFV